MIMTTLNVCGETALRTLQLHDEAPPLVRHDFAQRLPAELLSEIFDMCSPPGDDGFDGLDDDTTPEQEVERLAKKYLLQLSRVCSRWHDIVMGTPMLWSSLVVDTTLWDAATPSSEALLDLVSSSLERGCDHPLGLQVAVVDHTYGHSVFDLLCQHSRRWRHFRVWNALPSLHFLARAIGHLPLLETVEISNQNDDWTGSDVLQAAPRLHEVTFTGWAANIPTLPWHQLRYFRYINIVPNDYLDSLPLLRHASSDTLFLLEIDVTGAFPLSPLTPVVSDVSSLSLTFSVDFGGLEPSDVLGTVLGSLTLPCLDSLGLMSELGESLLSWNQEEFLSLTSRSALHANLTELELCAKIQDHELLQCLAALPLLESMILSESENDPHAFITDILFTGLILRPNHATLSPVPHLSFVCLTSRLSFTDGALWSFVGSRITPTPHDDGLTQIKIYWLPSRTRELSETFFGPVPGLEAGGKLTVSAGPDPDFM
ncbi:hypothetical protein B0H11DRAFT_2068865 [Mycena galericulata]|nr:hypothetical protein B0H11DRAFT_2068865 [Mycena galericulata]